MQVLRHAAIYFLQVFAVGFGLGIVRVGWLLPRLGGRTAELLELPVMMFASAWLAGVRHRRWPTASIGKLAAVGGLALWMLLGAECLLGWLQGRSPAAVLFDRDPVAGPAYFVALAWFAAAPAGWAFRAHRQQRARNAAVDRRR